MSSVTKAFQTHGDLRKRPARTRRPSAKMAAPMPRKPKPPTCEDCYFHKNLLCALELKEPCATFRPNRPEGLVPPRQPVLLMRAPRWASRPA
jgi:hypothetical protein